MICFCLDRFCVVVFLVLGFFVLVFFVAVCLVVVFLVVGFFCALAFVGFFGRAFVGVFDFALLLDFILRVVFLGSFTLRALSKLISDKKLESVAFLISFVFGILGVLAFLGLDFVLVFTLDFALDFALDFGLDFTRAFVLAFALDFVRVFALDLVEVLARLIFVLCICMFLFGRFLATILVCRFGLVSALESYPLACRVSA